MNVLALTMSPSCAVAFLVCLSKTGPVVKLVDQQSSSPAVIIIIIVVIICLQCFDAVGWAAGRASGL